jgi:hypothetical protein
MKHPLQPASFSGFLCRRDRFRTYDPYRVKVTMGVSSQVVCKVVCIPAAAGAWLARSGVPVYVTRGQGERGGRVMRVDAGALPRCGGIAGAMCSLNGTTGRVGAGAPRNVGTRLLRIRNRQRDIEERVIDS